MCCQPRRAVPWLNTAPLWVTAPSPGRLPGRHTGYQDTLALGSPTRQRPV